MFSEALRTAGFTSRVIPGERALYGLFNRIGETLPSMALARQAARLAKGRSRAAMAAAGEAAADQLASMVQPFAGRLFAEHRAAGRPLVLATTTPYDLVRPLADRLGLDDVVATRYGVGDDGRFDGTLQGPFVWAAGKLAAVRAWAEEHDIDLKESHAYSDSYFDAPLLAAVGHPHAVNPERRMAVLATLRRWPIVNLDVSPGVVKIPVLGIELQQVAMQFSRPELIPYARFDIAGIDHIPSAGPAILVANHRSYFDSVAMSMAIARSGRTVRFLGKKEVFDAPIVGQVAAAMGGIRVDRGTGSDEPLQAAADALAGGEVVAVMPQGTIPRGPAFFDPELKGRWGAAAPGGDVGGAGDPDRAVGDRAGVAAVEPAAQRPQRRRPARGPRPSRRAGRRQAPLAGCRHEADHEGDHATCCRPRPTSTARRRPRSWPGPTRPATAAIRRPSAHAVRARTDPSPARGSRTNECALPVTDRRPAGRPRRPPPTARRHPLARAGDRRRLVAGHPAVVRAGAVRLLGRHATTGVGSRPS